MNQNHLEKTNAEILIVDDMPSNLDLLCQTLESAGYQILAASSGEVALKIASQTLPDLILLDMIINKNVSMKATSQYLGHSSTAITLDMYVKDRVDIDELFDRDRI